MMKLFWENEVNGNTQKHYLLKRQTPTLRPFMGVHSHDYAELIYVERGRARHQINDKSVWVGKGDVLFMYPETVVHRYLEYDKSFSILQILFQQDSFQFIRDRYVESIGKILDESSSNPLVNLEPMQQIWFERNFDILLVNEGSLIEIERFLLNFFGLIRRSRKESDTSNGSWLDQAFREIQEPRNFRMGTKGFVDLCNHSPEHVEREVKKRTGRTVTDVVNQARMAWASYMLIFSDTSITEIAFGCGLESMSYFYKLFHEYYRVSPAKYRKQSDVGSLSHWDYLVTPFN